MLYKTRISCSLTVLLSDMPICQVVIIISINLSADPEIQVVLIQQIPQATPLCLYESLISLVDNVYNLICFPNMK